MRYLTNELSFDVPPGFEDQSLHVLYPARGASEGGDRDMPDLHVTIGRAPLGEGALEDHLPGSSEEQGITRSHVTVRRRRSPRLDAVEQRAVVDVGGDVLFERTLLVRLGGSALVLSCVGPVQERQRCDEMADAIVGSLKLRRGGGS